MSDQLHILITGDEGKGRNFLLSKRKLKSGFFLLSSLFLTLTIVSYNAFHLFQANNDSTTQVAALNNQLASLTSQLDKSKAENETLALQINSLKQRNSVQEETFLQEKQTLLNTTVTELEERSDMIERIMSNIGVDVKDTPVKNSNNSGGPFIESQKEIGKDLLYRSDEYLNAIHFLPLGRPVPGRVSSRFGHRNDPVNGKRGFHTGIDLRGRTGDKIIATADGVVTKAFWNGGYGRYIEIDHGNGYTTKFAHMKKLSVKRGDKVTRGQQIGTVGNSGRSTGSHLHYEICHHGKPINPSNFMHTEKLTQAAMIKQLSAVKSKKIKQLLVVKNQQPAIIPEK